MKAALADWLRRREQWLVLTSALILLLGAAAVHGLWTDRWGGRRELEDALARMSAIPLEAVEWRGQEQAGDPEKDDAAARVGIARIARRQFTRMADGAAVSVIVMGGRFGPLSVHTPDVCYGGAGYTMSGKPARLEFTCADGSRAVFWTAVFHKTQSPEVPPLRIFWGWNTGNGWEAPGNPRFAFRMKPVLFKLYAAREMASANEPLDQDAASALLKSWLPLLNRTLF
jgi:hypothetical protein